MEILLFFMFLCFCSSHAVDKVVFVDKYGIYHSDIEPGKLLTAQTYKRAHLEHIRAPGDMTYDFVTNKIIWAQRDPHKISADILDGVPNATDIVTGIKPYTITFNDYDRRIYWFGNVSRLLNSITINATGKIRLAKMRRHIYGLSVDGSHGFLYYSYLDRIVRMKVDGSDRTAILKQDLANVTAFTRNAQDHCLYWINEPGIIERYDTVTNERSTLQKIPHFNGHVEHIVVYNGMFYWVDMARGGIGYIDLNDASNNGFVGNVTVSGMKHSIAGVTDMKVFINEEVDYCSSSPCGEGAICNNQRLSYVCLVSNTTMNTTSEVPGNLIINPCEHTGEEYPCDDLFGSCMNENGTANCSCDYGYNLADDGVTCIANKMCSDCVNGECLQEGDDVTCVCYTGFSQENGYCEDIDECENTICDPEYGECVNTVGAYYCGCAKGFIIGEDGVACQVDCSENVCLNGGTCEDNHCECGDDFEGKLCEYDEADYEGLGGSNSTEWDDCDDDDVVAEWGLSTIAIVVITVVIIVVILFVIVIILACCRRKKNKKNTPA